MFLFVLTFAMRAWRQPAASGNAAMQQSSARILSWHEGKGTVQAHGEIWSAIGDFDQTPGALVEIIAVEGLTLTVANTPGNEHKEVRDVD